MLSQIDDPAANRVVSEAVAAEIVGVRAQASSSPRISFVISAQRSCSMQTRATLRGWDNCWGARTARPQ
jgi:hypothetical protein